MVAPFPDVTVISPVSGPLEMQARLSVPLISGGILGTRMPRGYRLVIIAATTHAVLVLASLSTTAIASATTCASTTEWTFRIRVVLSTIMNGSRTAMFLQHGGDANDASSASISHGFKCPICNTS